LHDGFTEGALTVAISMLEYRVIREMRDSGLIPQNPKVLEFGDSQWYGDVPCDTLQENIREYVPDKKKQAELSDRLAHLVANPSDSSAFEIVGIFFQIFLNGPTYASIDILSPLATYNFDLNRPIDLKEEFDFTINFGTAEHVFNVLQFFKTMHERTKPGGLMLHTTPFLGWPDHGFFSFQPTFFFDMARANGYPVLLCLCTQLIPWNWIQIRDHDHYLEMLSNGKIPSPSVHCFLFRKPRQPREFIVPAQRVYSTRADEKLVETWIKLR
jgi:SAM-dependent methyltransferase